MTWRLRPSDHPVWRAKPLFYQLCMGSSYKLTGTVIVSLACHRLRSITTVFARHQLLYYDVHCCPPKYIYSPLKYTYNPPKYTVVHWSSLKYIGVHFYKDPVSKFPCRPRDFGNLFLRGYRVHCKSASRALWTIFLFFRKEYSSCQTCLFCICHTSESRKIFPITWPKGFKVREIKAFKQHGKSQGLHQGSRGQGTI